MAASKALMHAGERLLACERHQIELAEATPTA
jgi:hypothetical protein